MTAPHANETSQLNPAGMLGDDRMPQRVLLTLDDGYETPVYVHHRPAIPARLPVLYVHGIQSHPGWFVGSSSALADRGHPVFQVTRRGSGSNRVDRGHARSARQLLDDLAAACRFVRARTGSARLHLLGVSWGGMLAAAYAGQPPSRDHLASLTLIAPGIIPRVDVAIATKLGVALCLLAAPRKRFDIPLSDVELFTDVDAMRDYLRNDGLALHRATARFLFASRRLDRHLRRLPPGAVTAPTTLILSARDRIIDNAATRRLVDRITAASVHAVELPGAHVLEFEQDPTTLYAALAAAMADAEPTQPLTTNQ